MSIQSRTLVSVVASYSGTGSNVALDLGFVPTMARGYDVTNGALGWYWFSNMDGSTTTVRGVTEGGAIATISNGAGGITALDGSAGTGIGLTIGTDTTINIAGHGVIVHAMR